MRVARNIGALIEEGNNHAEHLQLRIGPRANALVGLQQIVGALDGEVGRLNWDKQMRGGHQRI